MEALSLLETLDIDPAVRRALVAGIQADLNRLEQRIQHDRFIIEELKLELAYLRFNEGLAENLGHIAEQIDTLS